MAERSLQHPWIDLLVPDGPFLSAPALDKSTVGERWPTRLDPEVRGLLIAAPSSEDPQGWDDSTWDARQQRVHTLLAEVLGYVDGTTLAVDPALKATHHIYRSTVGANFTLHTRNEPPDVRMVVICGPDASDDPERIAPAHSTWHEGWFSTPVQRAALLARHAGAELALVTNGVEHLLVNVATPTTGSAFWGRNALEDRAAQDAFVALLHGDRVLHRTRSTADLIRLSQDRQQELTGTLGKQVRRAAEALVNAISRANRTTRGELLSDMASADVYSAATRVLMRIVFLLVAEERGLLPVAENQLYATEYAASTLLDHLEEAEYRNRSVMQRQSGAWQRLMATSRAVHSGIDHHSLSLAAYGGSLFDPDQHPFLEGRVAGERANDGSVSSWRQLDVGVVDDFTMLTVLRHLQIADGQRLSFKALDVEQIGHVYEALLDHSAVEVAADQVVIGLVGKPGSEPEVRLADLEAWAADGIDGLASELVGLEVGSKSDTIAERLNAGLDSDTPVGRTLTSACGNDEATLRRVLPFGPVLRTDARGMALVFLPGDVYVTETSSKRDSGTAYTPRSLAEEVAKHTLDPLIYEPGPRNEADESKWKLKAPEDLLDLKICDPAVGSAAILVAAARHLAEALIQSRIEHGQLDPDALSTAAGDEEALDTRVEARRDVVSNCVYGVDRDPMAVEMAKLSMWLVTMAKDRPFTFLDHAIKCGDSLLGIIDLKQLRYLHLEPSRFTGDAAMPMELGASEWWSTIEDALTETEALRIQLRHIKVDDVQDARRKAELHARAEKATETLRAVANAVVAVSLSTASATNTVTDARLASLGAQIKGIDSAEDLGALRQRSTEMAEAGNPDAAIPRRFFHWPLAFPEVFEQEGGFDALVANPPFMGGQDVSGNLGTDYREHLVRYVASGQRGSSDLVGYFALRLSTIGRAAGFLATKSITQGQTLKVGLEQLVDDRGWTIYAATRMAPWPGAAGVNISKVWMTADPWAGNTTLDAVESNSRITPSLEQAGAVGGSGRELSENGGKAFQGYKLVAPGFEIDASTASTLCNEDPGSESLIRPYVNGDMLNGSASRHDPERLAIDFGVRNRAEAEAFEAAFAFLQRRVRDYVVDKAFDNPGSYGAWAKRWWQFERPRRDLREAIEGKDRVLALAATSTVGLPVFAPADWCFTHAVVVFAFDDHGHFGVLNSSFHWWWAVSPPGTGGSSMRSAGIRYTPTTCFRTFPMPAMTVQLERAAEELDRFRESWLRTANISLTEAYNRVSDPDNYDDEVVRMRELHVELDEAVKAAYANSDQTHDWSQLRLTHGHYEASYLGTRFTIAEEERRLAMDWLLELNYRRWAEENGTTFEQVMKETGNA